MPSSDSAGLHRVIGGGGASQIEGLLQSNGNIFLVNPAGIVIHNGARVETGGFVASTADVDNQDFMRGNYLFNKPGQAGAAIINAGSISVRDSGFAALVAPQVRNDGIIAAKLGKVALASTESFTLDLYGDDLIAFTTPEQVVDTLHTTDGVLLGVDNAGTLKAEGGTVLLTTRQLDGVVSSVVNNSGLVSAASAELAGGKIVFRGEGADVEVNNTGMVDASSATASGGSVRMTTDNTITISGMVVATGNNQGGNVVLTGNEVALVGQTLVDASGQQGGGTVLIGGNPQGQGPEQNAAKTSVAADVVIKADALASGNGGQVVVWSDDSTIFDGTISARGGATGGNGGWVETSGSVLKVGDNARVNTAAPLGTFGTWLLDPVDFVIAASGGDMTGTTLSANLNGSSNITILSDDGNIFVNDAVTWASNTTLTLQAYRDVNINANINATGDWAGLEIEPGTGGSGAYNLAPGAKVTLPGTNPSLFIDGQQYTVINSVEALQAINQNITTPGWPLSNYIGGYYALGSDIDASITNTWNGGEGFVPIGNVPGVSAFSGTFDGLGHTVTGLTINRPTMRDVGLFGYADSSLRNIGLVDAVVIGSYSVGGLVGSNKGTISNSYSTGTVNGVYDFNGGVGGLVGLNSGTISNSYSTSTVTGVLGVGGLVGHNQLGTIYNSYSTGSVNGDFGVGGFVGHNGTGSYISNSYSTGTVNGNTYVGGFVGSTSQGWYGSGRIYNSYSIGIVSGNDYVGGFVGMMDYGDIYNSYSTGAVNGDTNVGGFLGGTYVSGRIVNSYSTGVVTGNNYLGGFVGSLSGGSTTNSYWDIETSGLATSASGTELTTAQMMTMATFNDWDFDNIWSIDEGHDYPKLRNVSLSGGGNHGMSDPGPPGTGGGGDNPGGGGDNPGGGGDNPGDGGTGDNHSYWYYLNPYRWYQTMKEFNANSKEDKARRAESEAWQAEIQKQQEEKDAKKKKSTNTNNEIDYITFKKEIGFQGFLYEDVCDVSNKTEDAIKDIKNDIKKQLDETMFKEVTKSSFDSLINVMENVYNFGKMTQGIIDLIVDFVQLFFGKEKEIVVNQDKSNVIHSIIDKKTLGTDNKEYEDYDGGTKSTYSIFIYQLPTYPYLYNFSMIELIETKNGEGWAPDKMKITTGFNIKLEEHYINGNFNYL